MLKRGDKVYTQIVKNCSIKELLPIIKGKADEGSVIFSDGFKTYDGLVNYGYKQHFRINHSNNEGVHNHTFYLHIKECEFRYNCRNKNLYLTLFRDYRKQPLKLS